MTTGSEVRSCAVPEVLLGSLGVTMTAAATACGGSDEANTAQPPMVAAADRATNKLLTPRRFAGLRLFVVLVLIVVRFRSK